MLNAYQRLWLYYGAPILVAFYDTHGDTEDIFDLKPRGQSKYVLFVVQNGHTGSWISTSFYGWKSVASLLIQLMVLLSGASHEKFYTDATFIIFLVGTSR